MKQYECEFKVNGIATEQIIGARSKTDAKQIIQSMYKNVKITGFKCHEVDKDRK